MLFLIVVVPSALPAIAIVLLTSRRGLRGVGSLLAPAVTALIFDLAIAYALVAGARPGALVAVAVGFSVVSVLFSAAIWVTYRRGRFSDHGIVALLVWFYQTVMLVFFAALSGANDARHCGVSCRSQCPHRSWSLVSEPRATGLAPAPTIFSC